MRGIMITAQLPSPLADPGGAHPARAPSNGRGPMICNCPKRYFSHFFSSLAINLIHNFNKNMAKTR